MNVIAETELSSAESSRSSGHRTFFMISRESMDAANALTLAGLAAAVACSLLAMNGLLAYAVVALMVSGLCDLFDGVVARSLNRSDGRKNFGGHLDSLVDACSFGFAPLVLMYAAGLNHMLDVPLLLLFAACVVWRLAYFDTVGFQSAGARRYYTGLPTTYVALILPLVFLAGFGGNAWLRGSLGLATVGLALAMVSSLPIRKPSGICYWVFPILGLSLAGVFVMYADEFMRDSL